MKPIYIHSGMAGAPQYANADGNINAILEACLVNGFNSKTATSASASGGVLTLNFAADPLFEPLQTVELAVSSAALVNGVHRVVANSNNQVTIAIAGLPDGPVGSSGAGITIKQAGAGWSKPFSNSTVAVFRPPTGNRRYLRCEQTLNELARVRAYEEMTDLNTGSGAFPSPAQSSISNFLIDLSSDGSNWLAIVSEKSIYFCLGSGVSSTYTVGYFYFGDLADVVLPGDTYATILCTKYGKWLPRNYLGETGSVSVESQSFSALGGWPSPVAQGVTFLPNNFISHGGVYRGNISNFYKPSNEPPVTGYLMTPFANVAGVAGRVQLVPFDAGSSVNFTLSAAFSIDEEVWG